MRILKRNMFGYLRVIVAAIFISFTSVIWAYKWEPDDLGAGFKKRYVEQGISYDGRVRSTIVRFLSPMPTQKAVLYIHGFNDYFFQADMAQRFAAMGYDFYAVDLRRYGRSLEKWQKRCQVRSLNEYFADIDSALTCIRLEEHAEIVVMGHSTGGLVSSYYLACNPAAPIDALLLNSPFLDWNLGNIEWLIDGVSALGKIFPDMPVPQGSGTGYGESLLRKFHGEWEYNTSWKVLGETKVDAGWVRAINEAQEYLQDHPHEIRVPVLLMFSSKSASSDIWTSELQTSDAVLDVKDIEKYGRNLGYNVTSLVVPGGMHDLVLSRPNVRNALYKYIFKWMDMELPPVVSPHR